MIVTESVSISDVARESLDTADGDWKVAAGLMRDRVSEDAALRDVLFAPLMDSAIWTAIRTEALATRRAYHVAGLRNHADRNVADDGIARLAESNALSLLDFPLRGGLRLGDATHAEVMEAAVDYLKRGRTIMVRGKWLMAVAHIIASGGTVAEKVSVDRLSDLLACAEDAVPA